MATERGRMSESSSHCVFCIGTADTKLHELQFLADELRSHLCSLSGSHPLEIKVTVVDVSASSQDSCSNFAGETNFVSSKDVLSCYFQENGMPTESLPGDRGEAVAIMSKALTCFLTKACNRGSLAGAIGIGGTGGTSLIAPALRSLPLGVPKLIISTVASGQTEPYIGTSDLLLFPSVVDICGLNSVSRMILSNAASATCGMVIRSLLKSNSDVKEREKPTVGLTMFGVTTVCVNAVKERLEKEGFETLVFHATGVGGRAMEDLVRGGFIQGVLDVTTTEVADFIVGGVMACDCSRFDAMIERKIPTVISVGALDMVNFGAKHTVPSKFETRKIHMHNEQVSLMRTNLNENRECAKFIAEKVNKASSRICICLPLGGVSALDARGKPFYDPEITTALIEELKNLVDKNEYNEVKVSTHHINDTGFANLLVDSFLELCANKLRCGAYGQSQNLVTRQREMDLMSNDCSRLYIPSSFPEARKETLERTRAILQQLRAQINNRVPIIGAGAGTGISAKFEEVGGVDLIVLYNSGRFRMAGRGSLSGLLPFADANAIVLEMANEVLPVVRSVPVLAGVCATDPFRKMDQFLKHLEMIGFSGVQNFPTVGLFDGNFRKNIEETGMGYGLEVEMVSKAHRLGLLTTPYAFNSHEAAEMAKAGADIVVAHMGLTTSGSIGAKTFVSLEDCLSRVQAIADAAVEVNPNIIILCHGGPISGPAEAEFILKNTSRVHGFYGASSMERLPVEQAIANTVREYKAISLS